jgi:hypothetical protein
MRFESVTIIPPEIYIIIKSRTNYNKKFIMCKQMKRKYRNEKHSIKNNYEYNNTLSKRRWFNNIIVKTLPNLKPFSLDLPDRYSE